MKEILSSDDAEERKTRKEECVRERTRLKRSRADMESQARQNLFERNGFANDRALFEGVMTGVYAVASSEGRPGRPRTAEGVLRRIGLIATPTASRRDPDGAQQPPVQPEPDPQQSREDAPRPRRDPDGAQQPPAQPDQ
ncbi:hypothetical protein CYMTET_35972 [Cymbomonas tetramitiformis]|uniref:Uncharacterized protein n=1 Tax=Cymbomonas tetramitiformis TaxID=36881 RepID=A0AAE0F856_9CHLO|nr:hypothetical protein CYMTET_35972 [Cymbomonas tetramitiformis]